MWPNHDRISCYNGDTTNSYTNPENGTPRCNRCFALENVGDPIDGFVIEAHIREKIDPAVLRERGLKKLTWAERKALGLD